MKKLLSLFAVLIAASADAQTTTEQESAAARINELSQMENANYLIHAQDHIPHIARLRYIFEISDCTLTVHDIYHAHGVGEVELETVTIDLTFATLAPGPLDPNKPYLYAEDFDLGRGFVVTPLVELNFVFSQGYKATRNRIDFDLFYEGIGFEGKDSSVERLLTMPYVSEPIDDYFYFMTPLVDEAHVAELANLILEYKRDYCTLMN